MVRINVDLTQVSDKFTEVILYIAERCETDPRFSVTKLNKILFYSDFISFSQTGHSITGQKYQKLNYGPCPRGMKPVSEKMEAERELVILSRPYYGRTQKKPIALRSAKLDFLSSEEISLIDAVIEAVWEFSASEISDLSHEFVGWEIAEIGETIPYGLAWMDAQPEFTEEEVATIRNIPRLSSEEKKASLASER